MTLCSRGFAGKVNSTHSLAKQLLLPLLSCRCWLAPCLPSKLSGDLGQVITLKILTVGVLVLGILLTAANAASDRGSRDAHSAETLCLKK